MDQSSSFGMQNPPDTGGNVFGSRLASSTQSSNIFGGQVGQQSNPFGSPVGLSSTFGQSGAPPTVFGSVSSFGTASTGISSSTPTFAATSKNVFGGSTTTTTTNTSLFGGKPGTTPQQLFGTVPNSSAFGAQSGFGATSVGKTKGSPSVSSQLFGSTTSHSQPFGTSHTSSGLFSGGSQSQTFNSPFGASVPKTTSSHHAAPPPSFTQSIAVNPFSMNQPQSVKTTSPGSALTSATSVASANLFSTDQTSHDAPPSYSAGTLFGSQKISGGFRKRSSSAVGNDSSLFGKRQGGAPPGAISGPQKAVFNSAPLFGGVGTHSMGSTWQSGTDSKGGSNSAKPLFGKDPSDTKKNETASTSGVLFGKKEANVSTPLFPITSSSQNTDASTSHEFRKAEKLFSAPAHDKQLFGHPVQPSSVLFGKEPPTSGPPFSKLPGKEQDLFGKKTGSEGLFKGQQSSGLSRNASSFNLIQQGEDGTSHQDSSSQSRELFGVGNEADDESPDNIEPEEMKKNEEGSQSPSRKSLSKWNRGRGEGQSKDERKRGVEAQDSETGQTKRSRILGAPGKSPSPRQRSASVRRSIEDLSSKTGIVVKDVPPRLAKSAILKKHFSQFGKITRLQVMAHKRAANVTFETHEEAANAKNNGKFLSRGEPPLTIFWRNTSLKSPETRPARQKGDVAKKTVRKSPVPGSVEDELASMSGAADFEEAVTSPAFQDFEEPKRETEAQRTSSSRRQSPTPTPPPAAPKQSSQVTLPSSAALDLDIAKGLLKAIRNARPRDTTERIAVLDSKDKLLRLLRGRQQADLASAKAFSGACPDMCPEKERYYREDIRRLALYEVIPSTMTSVTGLKSKVDHNRAVKEYSRSSADQEEPLPHELRPLPVLVKTMNYLLSEVADQGDEGKWAEWYDFLWNRTRGIRKDVTQQQLCDVQVAELLEKCARFHIFCSARLCEEDMMSFDDKINNENLTKCLQTLKELYADLETKHGVYCQNEAEFRAYMVLMNLNEGDILREIQQLRPEIRESPNILFAVKAYNALNTNNYVRFFRLIEENATFLNACILHRYFNQIRSKALFIIMKAHGAHGKSRVMYPAEELIRLLCFEDANEVEEFCGHYCLALSGVDVVLDAKMFHEPESSLPQRRSQSLVEVKRVVSVGEVINGFPLPPLELISPSSSFGPDGVFIMSSDIHEALAASGLQDGRNQPIVYVPDAETLNPYDQSSMRQDQMAENRQPDSSSGSEVKPQGLPMLNTVQKERIVYSNEVIKSLARTVILDVLDSNIKEIAEDTVREEMAVSSVIMSEVDDMASATVKELSKTLAEEVYEEEESQLRKKLAEEMAAQRQRVFTALCDGIVEDTVADMVDDITGSEMKLVQAELHQQSLDRCTQNYKDDLLDLVVGEVIQDVAQEVHEVDVVAKRERLEATEKLVGLIRCRRFFQAWRANYLAQIRVKRAMLDFPSAPSAKSTSEQLQKLVPTRPDARILGKSFYIGERAKLCIESPMEVIQQQLHLDAHLSLASARQMLVNLVLWQPLDMTQTVGPQLHRAFQSWKDVGIVEPDTTSMQWKLSISLPKKEQSAILETENFTHWIRAKLCKNNERDELLKNTPDYQGEILSLYHMDLSSRNHSGVSIGLCVRTFHGPWTETQELDVLKKDVLKGTSAVVLVTSCAEELTADEPTRQLKWKEAKRRLHQILKQKSKNPALPLVIIVPRLTNGNQVSVENLTDYLELTSLHASEYLSSVHVAQPFIGIQEQPMEYFEEWTTQLTNCLRFAATNVPAPPKLRTKQVSDYVEDAVVEFYKAPVYQDLRTRTRHQMLHQSPHTLLSLYNDVVEHVAMAAASSSLTGMSWPVPEFDQSSQKQQGEPQSTWNSEAHLSDLYELIIKVRLPFFRYGDMDADDWSSVCRDIWAYVETLTKKDSGSAKICLMQQVSQLLSRARKNFDQFCWLASEDGECEPTYVNMAWTDLVDACIHYKLVSLRTGHITIRKPEDEDAEAEEKEEEEYEEVLVHYQEEELEDWEPPGIWIDAQRDTETGADGQIKPTVEKAAAERNKSVLEKSSTLASTGQRSQGKQLPSISHIPTGGKPKDDESVSSWARLRDYFEQEREASAKYEKTLSSIISLPSIPMEQMFSKTSTPGLGVIQSPITPFFRPELMESLRRSCESEKNVPYGKRQSENNDIYGTPKTSLTGTRKMFKNLNRSSDNSSLSESGKESSRLGYSRRSLHPELNLDSEMSSEKKDTDRLSSTLSEGVSDLQNMLIDQKEANRLFEMKLKSLMDSPLLL